jgi:hypothetical protein
MCGGISFNINKIDSWELDRFLTPHEFEILRKGDSVQSFFWQRRPFLPVLEGGGVHLYDWGNRDPELKLPKTGLAKVEALRDSQWDWLAPQVVKIPAIMGYQNRRWFKTPCGLKAIKVRYHNIVRVYLLTTKADREFLAYTGHDRMPIGEIIPLTKINNLNNTNNSTQTNLFVRRSFSKFASQAWSNNFRRVKT